MRVLLLAFLVSGCVPYNLDRVNWEVNTGYPYVSDQEQFGVHHKAQRISITGKGDCEDYAIEKMIRLREMGYCSKLVYHVPEGADCWASQDCHMALASEGYVLDNKTNHLYPYDPSDWTGETISFCPSGV